MKKIVVLISTATNNEIIIKSAIKLAKFLNLEISIYYLIEGPNNWESLGRSARDKFPLSKTKINNARILMDKYLGIIRTENISATKAFLFYDLEQPKSQNFENENSLVITSRELFITKNESLTRFIDGFSPNKLIIDSIFNPLDINDIVFSSDFHTLLPQSLELLNQFTNKLTFHLNLVFIETKMVRENSEISIKNMKHMIDTNCFRKTSISIFNADCRLEGAKQFANIKGGDLIITEEKCERKLNKLKEKHLPLLILDKF